MAKHGVTEFLEIFQGDVSVFFDVETDLLIVLDDHGAIIRVNPAFERCLGRSEASVLGLPIINIMALDDLPANTNMPRLLRHGGGLVNVNLITYKYKSTDEGKRWYLILRPIRP